MPSVSILVHEFEEFMDHNEFELAWDSLADAARHTNATSECWANLEEAAALMGFSNKKTKASERSRRRNSRI
jgi:hypothetical protein